MRILSTLLATAALAAATMSPAATPSRAERGEARIAKALEGRVAGAPVDCIQLRDIQSSEIIDGTAILYRTIGNRYYLNRPEGGASSLDNNDILVTDTRTSQLCDIDIVRLIDRTSHFYSGFVNLGSFVPYTKPKAADAR